MFDGGDDKDARVFPVTIPGPSGQPAMAIRPPFPVIRLEETACHPRLLPPDYGEPTILT